VLQPVDSFETAVLVDNVGRIAAKKGESASASSICNLTN
jgi:hypothetical protein